MWSESIAIFTLKIFFEILKIIVDRFKRQEYDSARLKILRQKRKILMLYNAALVRYQMRALGHDERSLARAAGIAIPSAYMASKGALGTLAKLKAVADALKIKWQYITHIDLPEREFHRAVLTTGERRGRTVKSRPVSGSANRPR